MLHSGGPGPSTTGKKASSGPRLPLVLQEPSWILLKFVLFSKLQSDWEKLVVVVVFVCIELFLYKMFVVVT